MLVLCDGLQALSVEEFEFDPNENCALIEAPIGLQKPDRVHLLEARAERLLCSGLQIKGSKIEISRVSLLTLVLGRNLLSYHCLVVILHLVQIIRLQVIHQDGETAHDFRLFFDLGR